MQLDDALSENEQLKQLLADYGLVWLGTQHTDQSDSVPEAQCPKAEDALLHSETLGAATSPEHLAQCSKSADALHTQSFGQQTELCAVEQRANDSNEGSSTSERPDCSAVLSKQQAAKLAAGSKAPSAEWLAQCVRQLNTSLQELNSTVRQEHSHLVSVPDGHTLPGSQAVALTVWRDGLQLHGKPLAPWSTSECTAMLRDVVEGVAHVLIQVTVLACCSCTRHVRLQALASMHKSINDMHNGHS